MAAQALRLGPNAKLYYTITGAWDSETWVEVSSVESLTVSAGFVEATGPDRATGLETVAKTMGRLSLTGRIRINELAAPYLAMATNAIQRDTALNLLCLNGPKTSEGAAGFKGYFHILDWEEEQGMNNVLYKRFTLKPAIVDSASFPFKSALVSSGSVPVYTNFIPPS